MKGNGSTPVFIFRFLVLALVGLWGWYFCAMFRTSGWGYDDLWRELWGTLLVFSIFALPFGFLPLIGVSWRRKFAVLTAFTCLCVLAVEVFARTQEYLVLQSWSAAGGYIERRWWPFEHHDLGLMKDGTGWGCD